MTDVTKLKTITFDPSVYKLVPIDLANDLDLDHYDYRLIRETIANVPDQLPGMVEHSGEPVGEIICNFPQGWHMQALVSWNQIGQGTKLYTHPAPLQPDFQPQELSVELQRCHRYFEVIAQPHSLYWQGREIKTQNDLIDLMVEMGEKGFDAGAKAALESASNYCLSKQGWTYEPKDLAEDILSLNP